MGLPSIANVTAALISCGRSTLDRET